MTSDLFETWRGEAVNWECDELGHLNMRHYVGKFFEARQMLMIRLGLPHTNLADAHSLTTVQDIHIRYHREARPGQKLFVESGIIALNETDMTVVHIMSHACGAIAATQVERLSHVSRATGLAFNWPGRTQSAAKNFMTSLPDAAKSRGLNDINLSKPHSLNAIKKRGLMQVGTGVFRLAECDLFGRITAQSLFGRLSECVSNFEGAWPEKFGPNPLPHHNGVLLEMKATFHQTSAPGQGFVLHSGLKSVDPTIRRLAHIFFDANTQTPIASLVAVNGVMDLNARKLVKARAEDLATLESLVQADL